MKFIKFLFTLMTLMSVVSVKADGAFVVVLDPGHGGKDCGALGVSKKLKEKDINLIVSNLVAKKLEREVGVKIVRTRSTDVFITLDERPKIANRNNANLFVSIHANASPSPKITGVETYTLGDSRNDVSVRENKVAEMESGWKDKYNFDGSDENFIMSDIMLDAGSGGETSIRMAQMVQSKFREKTDRIDRSVWQADFWVLKHILCPGVLVEMGYLSNAVEEKYLSDHENLEKIADAIYEAIVWFKKDYKRRNGDNTEAVTDTVKKTVSSEKTEKVKKNVDSIVPSSKSSKQELKNNDIVYRIQLFSTDKELPALSKEFKTCTPAIPYKDGNYYKYMFGEASTLADAQMLKRQARMDFPDAFIVVFKGDKKLVGADAAQYLK